MYLCELWQANCTYVVVGCISVLLGASYLLHVVEGSLITVAGTVLRLFDEILVILVWIWLQRNQKVYSVLVLYDFVTVT